MSRSSTKVEYRSLASLVAELSWIRNLLDELQAPHLVTPLVYCDNLSAVMLATNPILHSKSKHFELDLHFVRDHVTKGRVHISHIPAEHQLADILTKLVSSSSFTNFRDKLKIVDPKCLSLRGDVRQKA